ncbi:MAG: LysM peptidoglycan-binding domain-containing protein [Candidatus Omnitrophica bacterium]|nr:LysM peptidoglycan-binding domain-containing protein [Candidatus Omnitrophota bacterium]
MRRILIASIVICVCALNISGCVKRVSIKTIEKERVDQDTASGNKGFISGTTPPSETTEKKQTTRKIYQVTLELPPYAEWKNFRTQRTEDKELWGNRGYVYGGPQAIIPKKEEKEKPQKIILPDDADEEAGAIVPPKAESVKPAAEKVKFTTYTVTKGDTLQIISKKVYGTTKRWQKIFEFNKGTLKNPNKIYPGQKILIPQD